MTPTLITLGLLFLIVACVGAGVQIGLHARLRPPPARHKALATRHNPTLTDKALSHVAPRAPDPAIVIPPIDVVFRPGQVKPDYGDATEIRTRVIEESPYARWRRHG